MLARQDAQACPALRQPLARLQLPGLPPGPQEQLNSVLVHEPLRLETSLAQLACRQLAQAALPAEAAAAGQYVPEYDDEPPPPELLLEQASDDTTSTVTTTDTRRLMGTPSRPG